MEQSVRFNGYPAMELSGSPVNGVSSGQAMTAVQQMVDDMGGGYSLEWGGQSREEARRQLANCQCCMRIGRCRCILGIGCFVLKAGLSRWRLSLDSVGPDWRGIGCDWP